MNTTLESIGIGMAVFAVLIVAWLISRKKSAKANNPAPEFQTAQRFTGNAEEPVLIGPDAFAGEKSNIAPGAFEAEVRMLIDYGNKAAAIRVVREKMGLDLKDAKDLVDKMEQGTPLPISDSAPVTANDSDKKLCELVHSGRLIEAIKLVREKKGLDLKEAKAYVERL